jgi:hypothetical protein
MEIECWFGTDEGACGMPTRCKKFQEVIDEWVKESAKVQLQLAEKTRWSESRTRA